MEVISLPLEASFLLKEDATKDLYVGTVPPADVAIYSAPEKLIISPDESANV